MGCESYKGEKMQYLAVNEQWTVISNDPQVWS
jgi:hypothetical protein